MRRIALVATGAAAAVTGVLLGAGTAAAAPAAGTETQSATAYIIHPTTGYSSPSNQSVPVLTGLNADQKVTALCFTEGQVLGGNHYWFRVSTTPQPDGNTGFVHKEAISVQGDLRHC